MDHALKRFGKLFMGNRNLRMRYVPNTGIKYVGVQDHTVTVGAIHDGWEAYPDRIGRFARRSTIAINSVDFPLPLPPILSNKYSSIVQEQAAVKDTQSKNLSAPTSDGHVADDSFVEVVIPFATEEEAGYRYWDRQWKKMLKRRHSNRQVFDAKVKWRRGG